MAETDKRNSDNEEVETVPKSGAKGEPVEVPVNGPEDSEAVDSTAMLEARVADLEDQKLRALAELDNYRKRMTRRFDEVVQTANDRLLGEILDVIDNFERALAHARENGAAGTKPMAALLEGTEMIHQQLLSLLERYQVSTIESVGRPFDPNLHEAMMQVDSGEYDQGIVAAEISKGYRIGDRVLRHARVAVSRGQGAGERPAGE